MSDYVLLVSERSGLHLSHTADHRRFQLRRRCDDSCIWTWESVSSLRNAQTGSVINLEARDLRTTEPALWDEMFGPGASKLIAPTYRLMTEEGEPLALGDQDIFGVRQAPDRLPSDYLVDLERQGWTVVENIMLSLIHI